MKGALKKTLFVVLIMSLLFSFGVFADDKQIDKNKVGEELKSLGFIKGDGNGNLNTKNDFTREQAVVVLTRLMNKESQAEKFEEKINFTDVDIKYYKPFIAYAVQEKWVEGRSAEEFGFSEQITNQEFSALILRALGYTEYKGEKYSEVPEISAKLGIQNELNLDSKANLTRGDAFVLIKNALAADVKDSETQENLYESIFFKKYDNDDDKIVIIHTNDMHGFFVEGKYNGMGAAKVKRFRELIKSRYPDALYLDAGDSIQGANIVTLSKGEAAIEIMNSLGIDAMVTGNHEFDYGSDRLNELSKKAKQPVLACNVLDKDGNSVYLPYIIKEIKGKKIAIIGFATPETKFKSHPDNTKGLTFEDPVTAGQKVMKELEGKADLYFALAHLGDEKGDVDYTSIRLAENLPELDLIIDGHSHSTYEKGKEVNGVMIVQAGEQTKNVGYVTFDLNDLGKMPHASLFTKKESLYIKDDAETLKIVNKIKAENKKIEDQEIKECPEKLVGDREVVRKGESNLGNLLTASLKDISKADIALTNGGGIRDSIDAGMVKKGDILRVFPFGNTVRVIELSGKDVKAALEHGLSVYPEANGGFPHLAGLKIKVDYRKEAGSRLVEVLIEGKALEDDKIYTLATNDFLVAGGDGYKMFKDKKVVAEFGAMDEVLISYIMENGFEAAKVIGWLEEVK